MEKSRNSVAKGVAKADPSPRKPKDQRLLCLVTLLTPYIPSEFYYNYLSPEKSNGHLAL
jgi:hypothetical protein